MWEKVNDFGGDSEKAVSDKIRLAVGDGMWLVCFSCESGESAKDHLHM